MRPFQYNTHNRSTRLCAIPFQLRALNAPLRSCASPPVSCSAATASPPSLLPVLLKWSVLSKPFSYLQIGFGPKFCLDNHKLVQILSSCCPALVSFLGYYLEFFIEFDSVAGIYVGLFWLLSDSMQRFNFDTSQSNWLIFHTSCILLFTKFWKLQFEVLLMLFVLIEFFYLKQKGCMVNVDFET